MRSRPEGGPARVKAADKNSDGMLNPPEVEEWIARPRPRLRRDAAGRRRGISAPQQREG